jgi:hypothetical protein
MQHKKKMLPVGQSLDHYCEKRIPAHIRDKVRLTYRWRGSTVTLTEERPYFRDPKRRRASMTGARGGRRLAKIVPTRWW